MRLVPSIYVACVLQVKASGLSVDWPKHPPKIIRKDQWISDHAIVVGIEVEVMYAVALQKGEVVLGDLARGTTSNYRTGWAHWLL